MDDEFSKRHLKELERAARLADPLRDAKELLDSMKQVREQLEATRTEPMLRAQQQLEAMAKDPVEQARKHLEAAQLEPMLRAQERLAAIYRDPLDRFREQIKAMTDPMAQARDALRQETFTNRIQEHIQKLLEPIRGAQDWLAAYQQQERERLQQWRSVLEDFSRQMEEMPARLRAQLAALMERGWCLDPEMPHTWGIDLMDAIRDGEEEEAQQWLVAYFRSRLNKIEAALVERHPQRATVIAEAFAAHREGRYALSIPVLLAQAEGVIHDKHQRQLFSKKAKINLKTILANLPGDDARAIFMSAFCIDTPLTRNTDELPANFDGLNRHAVLHGLDPKYGTEVNGLRAVSILNLASYLVTEEEDDAAAA